MSEVTDGYNFKLFSNSVNQIIRQNIYSHHLLLNETPKPSETLNHQNNSCQSYRLNDHDINPRSLSVLSVNNWSQNNSLNITINDQSKSTSPITFANISNRDHQFKTPAIPALSTATSTSNEPSNIVVGSYHSVSDISVLSDNENDIENDSIFSNSLNATTCSSMQNNSGNQSNSSSNTTNYTYNKQPPVLSTNKPVKASPLVSHSDEFEFLRPKEPPLPTQSNNLSKSHNHNPAPKYNPRVYSTGNSLNCSSNGGSMSSLSPSPSSSLSNINNQQPVTNGKSILFGIPRNYAPVPTYSAENSHHSIDSPFVDVTLNNCDDMTLYQPMKNIQINSDCSRPVLSPLTEQKVVTVISKPTISIPTPTNNLVSCSVNSLASKNNFFLLQLYLYNNV